MFEEQTRILVMFQLLINIGAQALQKQNRARVKDFLRKYFARKLEIKAAREQGLDLPSRHSVASGSAVISAADVHVGSVELSHRGRSDDDDENGGLINLQTSNAVQIRDWARRNKDLAKQATQYIAEQQAAALNSKANQEAQRIAAAERKKVVGQCDNAVPVTPAVAKRHLPSSVAVDIREEEEEKSYHPPVYSPPLSSPSVAPVITAVTLSLIHIRRCRRPSRV